MRRLAQISSVVIIFSLSARAQRTTTNQLWMDYVLDVPFAKGWLFENETSYQTVFSSEDKWRSLNLTPDIERAITKHFDLFFQVPLSYTVQTDSYETFETRLVLGSRFYFTPGKRVETRLTLRWEERMLTDLSENTTGFGHRGRIRAELVIPINRPTFSSDHMWYAIADGEVFLTVDDAVAERFSNQARIRAGLGYRLGYNLRMEAIYTYQLSRDHTGEEFDTRDNIVRLRLKHYLSTKHLAKERDNSN